MIAISFINEISCFMTFIILLCLLLELFVETNKLQYTLHKRNHNWVFLLIDRHTFFLPITEIKKKIKHETHDILEI